MDFWINFWLVILVAAVGMFAVLAIVVAIGGFKNLLALFRSIDAQHARQDTTGDQEQPETDARRHLP